MVSIWAVDLHLLRVACIFATVTVHGFEVAYFRICALMVSWVTPPSNRVDFQMLSGVVRSSVQRNSFFLFRNADVVKLPITARWMIMTTSRRLASFQDHKSRFSVNFGVILNIR
ncbi:hypothetical protein B0H34DRAFT_697539 [Crassisporium funariophilum]|nr:hypothetical protein B0H34DRAFT_697539 [Crassisporium funariophilum]